MKSETDCIALLIAKNLGLILKTIAFTTLSSEKKKYLEF